MDPGGPLQANLFFKITSIIIAVGGLGVWLVGPGRQSMWGGIKFVDFWLLLKMSLPYSTPLLEATQYRPWLSGHH